MRASCTKPVSIVCEGVGSVAIESRYVYRYR